MKLLITVVVIMVALYVLSASRRWRRQRAANLEYPAPGTGTDADVERFVAIGRRMTAIKLYREIHNVDLKTAKEAVDRIARGGDSPR